MPAAGTAEKEGTFTNTQRLLQYRKMAVEPPGDARSETWFMYHLGRRIKEKAQKDLRPRNDGLRSLTWDYTVEGPLAEPRVEEVLMEINGYTVANRKQLAAIPDLKNDGSTACGAWIYCGVFPKEGRNRANERDPKDLLGHGWGLRGRTIAGLFTTGHRRVRMGNLGVSARSWFGGMKKRNSGAGWMFPTTRRTLAPETKADLVHGEGVQGLGGARPFVLHNDGLGWLFVPSGLKDGPLPAHFEPLESPVSNPLYSQQTNPPVDKKERLDNPYADSPGDPRYPYVLTTYRLTEHHTAGGMSRTLSHLAELQPDAFTEVSPELAAEAGLTHGEFATISTPRGVIEARVLVTRRMRPLWINGKRIHQVGLPWHWGSKGLSIGDSANDLVAISEEPNVRIMESKALICNLRPGRRPRGSAQEWLHQGRAGTV